MEVFFHIGYPKTASTWLQEMLFPKIRGLIYLNSSETRELFFDSDAFLYSPLHVHKYISKKSDKNYKLLFSSELLTTPINYGWHHGCISKTCAIKIKDTYPNAKIILFIRNQKDLAVSAYQQYVKNGGTYSIRKFLYNSHFSLDHLFYSRLIKYYDSLFGRENVAVFFFEDFTSNPKKFVEKFVENFSFDLDICDLDFRKVNQGLRIRLIPIIRFFNLFHRKPKGRKRMIFPLPKMVGFVRKIVHPLNRYEFFGKHARFDNLLHEKDSGFFRDTYRLSNQELMGRLDVKKLEKYGYFF